VSARELITEHLDLWTGAVIQKSTRGRGSNGKIELAGIKKLRELILELAIRGKLVEQCASEEPARLLLERIKSEKHRLVVEGEIKKPRKLPSLSEMKPPFSPPERWEWAQLEDIGRDWGQKTPDESFSYIDVASIDNARGVTTEPSIVSANDAPSRARKKVQPGTLIYSTVRPYLQNIAVVENEISPEPIASTAFAILHPLANMPARFFLHYLRSTTFVRYVESVQTGIAYPAINDKQFFSGVVPIPPVEEQHRIVQKVDELMALCDRLEQQTSDQLEAHETLVDTLLGTLTQSENATELAENWARLAAHFDTLFTTEQSIDKLKQTILQLAVMGRLVEQDVGDEPFPSVLQKIKSEEKLAIKAGALKKKKKLVEIRAEDKRFQLPDGWDWAKFDHIAAPEPSALKAGPFGSALKKSMYVDSGYKIYGQEQVIVGSEEVGDYFISEEKYKSLESCRVRPGDILISLVGTIGRVLILSPNCQPGIINPRLVKLSLYKDINRKYISLVLSSPLIQEVLSDKSHGGTMNILNLSLIRDLSMPIPPVAEQHRIVQKVDELITLCDQLKERLNQASETRCQLAEGIVEGALKS
jgi:type I restriction enzyme S subunit